MSKTADVSYKWSEKGKQPLIEQKQYKRERFTLFGAVNPMSGEVIVQQAERGNAVTFKKYLKKVIKYYDKQNGKIYMILDNVKFHHAKILKPFLEKNKDKLDLMFLPAYSPDFNPIERVLVYEKKNNK
jgi:transposase